MDEVKMIWRRCIESFFIVNCRGSTSTLERDETRQGEVLTDLTSEAAAM